MLMQISHTINLEIFLQYSTENCASGRGRIGSGWWYGKCELSSLTLHYYTGNTSKSEECNMQWETWKESPYSIKATTMMIRRT